MSRRKANVRPDLVGELFSDGTSYFKLIDCRTEPTATFEDVRHGGEITRPISEFANLVLLKPVRPLLKPKKSRADTGKTHKKHADTLEPKTE